jgi:hypothetical protein
MIRNERTGIKENKNEEGRERINLSPKERLV